jgi:hypothetical protein
MRHASNAGFAHQYRMPFCLIFCCVLYISAAGRIWGNRFSLSNVVLRYDLFEERVPNMPVFVVDALTVEPRSAFKK